MLNKSNKQNKNETFRKIREEAERHSQEPAITLDQHQIEIAANLGKVQATAHAVEYGAEAIGLLRTELVLWRIVALRVKLPKKQIIVLF